jgi:hypothetical protein
MPPDKSRPPKLQNDDRRSPDGNFAWALSRLTVPNERTILPLAQKQYELCQLAGKIRSAFTLVTSEDAAMVRALGHPPNKPLEQQRLQNFDYTMRVPANRHIRSSQQLRQCVIRNEWGVNQKVTVN